MTERETVTDEAQRANSRGGGELPPPSVGGESVLNAQGPAQTAVASSDPLTAGVGPVEPVAGAGTTSAGGKVRIGDRVFSYLTRGASAFVIVLVVLIGLFLVIKSVPSIADDKDNFFTATTWTTTPGDLHFGIANLLWVTVIISLVALIIAVPVALGVALFITQYAPKRIAQPVAYLLDLLAAIPSIVYGVWGVFILAPALEPIQGGISHIPIPLFDQVYKNKTIFNGAVVLAVMILPIITAISRDVFARTPRANVEAALALGATKWEMIRMAVIPYGRPGVVSGAMLGLGRALGETIAVYFVVATVSPPFRFSIFTGGETFASKIANGQSEFNNPQSTGAYIAAGLVLFVLTFVVNSAARAIVNRKPVQ